MAMLLVAFKIYTLCFSTTPDNSKTYLYIWSEEYEIGQDHVDCVLKVVSYMHCLLFLT